MNVRKFSKISAFVVSTLFILFNNHLTEADWQIKTVDSAEDANNPQCISDRSAAKCEDEQGSLYHKDGYSKLKNPSYLEGKVIIKLKDNAYLSTIQQDNQISLTEPVFKHLPVRQEASTVFKKGAKSRLKADRIRASVLKRGLDRVHVIHLPSEVSVESVLRKYKDNPKVEYIQPNYIYQPDLIPNDPRYSEQYAHQLTQVEEAWDITIGSEDVTIAVIGTSIDIDHPDLNANIWINPDEIPDNDQDDDSNGYVDDVNGWDFEHDNNDPRPGEG